ncbi:MAG: hypothetical protein NXI22_26170, partial [bacterium]|nr:hypothetical protein [bacterium]
MLNPGEDQIVIFAVSIKAKPPFMLKIAGRLPQKQAPFRMQEIQPAALLGKHDFLVISSGITAEQTQAKSPP